MKHLAFGGVALVLLLSPALAVEEAPLTALPHPGELYTAAGSYDPSRGGTSDADQKACESGPSVIGLVEEPAAKVGWVHGGAPTGVTFAAAMGVYGPALMAGRTEVADQAKSLLLKWAKADALRTYEAATSGNWWAAYEVLPVAMVTFRELDRLGKLSGEDRTTIEGWLGHLIKITRIGKELPKGTAGYRDVEQRVNNHNTRRNLVAAMWAVLHNDVAMFNTAVENGYVRFLENIKDDGSLYDANRGMWAMRYSAYNISAAFFLGEVAAHQGVDLFTRQRNGHSIHDAVRFLLDAADDQAIINKYAKADIGMKGLPFRGSQDPSWRFDLDFGTAIGWFEAYLARFPASENAPRIRALVARYKVEQSEVVRDLSFGNVTCIYGATAARLTPPGAEVVVTTEPPTIVRTEEQFSKQPDGSPAEFNVQWRTIFTSGGGENEAEYHIEGVYVPRLADMMLLSIIPNAPIGSKMAPPGLQKCGYVKTQFWDDTQPRVVIDFKKVDGAWSAPQADCIASLLNPRAATSVRLLAHTFNKIVADFVASGKAKAIKHPGLRAWANDVAAGKVLIQ
ncbi:MAG: alginate lyase family protein [Bauldia sp.]